MYVIVAKLVVGSRYTVSFNRFAHVKFPSIEEASRVVRQGAHHGFRYERRLLVPVRAEVDVGDG